MKKDHQGSEYTCMHLAWKIVKIFIYILSGLVMLLLVASFFIDPIAKRLMEKEVGKAGEGQYTLLLDDVNISLLRGNILLKGIRFRTDTASRELAPVVMAEAREFSARGVNWLTFILERRLSIDQIKLDGLNLQLKARPVDTTQSGAPFRFDQLDVYPNIKEQVSRIHLHDLALNDIDFTLINALSLDTLQFSANRLNIRSKDILIDADKLITEERAFYAAYINFDGEELGLRRSGNTRWNADIDRLNLLTREDRFGVQLQSLRYLHAAANASDTLMLVDLQHFELQDLNLHKLQEDEIADIEKIRLSGVHFIHGMDGPSEAATEKDSGNDQAGKSMSTSLSDFSLGSFLPGFASSLEVKTLQFDDISYRQGADFSVNNFALTANEVVLDARPAFSNMRFLHAESLQSSMDQLEYLAADAGYLVSWEGMQLEADRGIAQLNVRQLAAGQTEKNYGTTWLDGEVARLQLAGIDTRRLEEEVLHIGSLSTEHPRLFLNVPQQSTSGTAAGEKGSSPDLYPALEGILEELSIGRLEVQEGNLQLTVAGGRNGRLSVPEWSVRLEDILIDQHSALTAERLLHSKEVSLDARNISYRFPDNTHLLQLGTASMSTTANELQLRRLDYGPLRTAKEDLQEAALQLSAVKSRTIELQGVDFHRLFRGGGLYATALGMHGTDVQLAGSNGSQKPEAAFPPENPEQQSKENRSFSLEDLNLSDRLPAFIKNVDVDAIEISGLNILEEERLMLDNFWLQASSFRLDNSPAFAENHFLHAKALKTGFDTLWILAGDPGHYLMAKDFRYTVENGMGRLELENILVKPQDMPRNKGWIEAEIPALIIPHINTRELSEGILKLDEIVIRKPLVVAHISEGAAEKGKDEEGSSPPDLFPLFDGALNEFRLRNLVIENADVRLAGFGGSNYGMSLHDLNMQLSDLNIAEGTAFEGKRLLHTAGIDLTLDQLILLFPDKVYSLQVNAVELNSTAQSIKANGLRYEYGGNFNKILEAPERNDVYRLVNKQLLVNGIDFQRLFKNEEFSAQTVRLNGLDLSIYKDLNMPEEERIKPMPRDIVFNMGMPFSIASLEVEEFAITYEEMAEGSENAGLVTLMDVSTSISNISNIREELLIQPDMQVTASGRLMGRGYFETQIDVPLLDEDKPLRIRGSIDTLDMSRLNRISRYNSRIAIEAGTLYKASWDFEANDELASGSFELSYEDLEVQLSSKNSPDTTGVLKDIGSYLVNLVVVDSNIAEARTKEPKKVVFEEKRNKNKSFFNFYVQSLLTGLMEAIGVPFQ